MLKHIQQLLLGVALTLLLLNLAYPRTGGLVNDRNITINVPADVVEKRQQLVDFIWGIAGFPADKLPSEVQVDVISPLSNLNNLERVDNLTIEMDELEGLAHHFIPRNKNNRLVIVHQGHTCTLEDGPGSGHNDEGVYRTIRDLLAEGFSVLAVYMPHKRPGDCWNANHDGMFTDFHSAGSPIKFFLESTAVSLNYMKRNYSYADYSMVGISGGGWTTTLYAAIDTDIQSSFAIAGSIPLYLRYEGYNHDQEQYVRDFYRIAGYPDLYVLGSAGPGRRQIQILNTNDNCCFGARQFNAAQAGMTWEVAVRGYESNVMSVLRGLQSGSFSLFIDETTMGHTVSDYALRNIILPILKGTD